MKTIALACIVAFTMQSFARPPQEISLHSLDESAGLHLANWRIQNLRAKTTDPAETRYGPYAMEFTGHAERDSAKGDIGLRGHLPKSLSALTLSIYTPMDGNVGKAGLQLEDAEGEMLVHTVPLEKNQWQRLRIDLATVSVTPAYRQDDKNGSLDLPIKRVNFIWYTEAAGPTTVAIDGLIGIVDAPPVQDRLTFMPLAASAADEGQTANMLIEVTNYRTEPAEITLHYRLQRNPEFLMPQPPHPELGSDQALNKRSWTEQNGERVSEGTLTDGDLSTGFGFPWGSDMTEADQIIDLGEITPITHLGKQAGDANWIFKVDIAHSEDGTQFSPVAGWQALNWHAEWGRQVLKAEKPLETRYLKLNYHNDGQPMQTLRMPTEISVYNGITDETMDVPDTGENVDAGKDTLTVPARSFAVISLTSARPLSRGSYLFSARYDGGRPDDRWVSWQNLLVLPPPLDTTSAESPFGINSAVAWLVDWNRKLGVGWVRFENLKWPMVSPAPGQFAFDGRVGPWHMDMDHYIKTYVDAGISVLPYLFQSPVFESSAPGGVTKNIKQYPPKDFKEYGKFVFQTVARYGSVEHPDNVLLTEDKVSGLGWMDTYELWNEHNLNDPGWGHWVGTFNDYLEMFRIGAEAAKRADPSIKITNAGLAGTDLSLVDQFRTYQYEDGKSPVDFIDVLNVHHYTQPHAPEIATVNSNIDRSGTGEGAQTFEVNLLQLNDWRNRYLPDAEIWLTETGFDTDGPRQVSLRVQAAYTPRNVLMILGSGIDKVMIFREMGSNPGLYAAAGVLDEDARPKGSFLSYATLIRVMDGATGYTRLPHPNPNVWMVGAIKDSKPVIAAWAIEGEESLDLAFGSAQVTDTFGHSMEQDVSSDFRLTIFPQYLESMDPELPRRLLNTAKEKQAARRAALEAERGLKAYLLDFGGMGTGAVTIGDVRAFEAVEASKMYSGESPYGFTDTSDQRANIDRQWIRDALTRDGVKVPKGTVFQFKADPGTYELSLMAAPLGGGEATVEIRGLNNGILEATVSRENDKWGPVTIDVGSEPVEISFPKDYGVLFWVSLIEMNLNP
ncbi:MAG: hypothetical protein PF795_14310 [Kiritimatiellae bacterium]|jgi:hypothetical protein|nr:hypothetical protein [Kiritimatiellia bacterium]